MSTFIDTPMISLGAYRSAIGNFNYTLQYNLKVIYRNFKINSSILNLGIRLLLKSSLCFILQHITLILLLSGDIELNPGPPIPNKSVKGSYHQGDSRLGNTAGSQCMCNAFWAICYSKIKSVCFWTQ